MRKVIAFLANIAFLIWIVVICLVITILATGKHVSVGGYQILRVLTSSMEPAIGKDSCIIIKEVPTEELKVGDIITFTSDDPLIMGYYNTHRIFEIVDDAGDIKYITKGDSVAELDAYPVHPEQVAGKFVRELPGGRILGKCFVALSDNKIYFIVIILPLMLCLISYFWQIIGLINGRYDEEDDD